jgi:hypothetical protein
LKKYLEQRVQLHDKVFSDDELVFAGSWIHHGNFDHVLKASASSITLNPIIQIFLMTFTFTCITVARR